MKWIDTGFLISKNKYNENSVIAEIFTLNNGKVTGIIFGASSKKIKSYLEIGNLLHVNYSSKSPEKIGSFKIEISKANTAFFFENKIKLNCILYSLNLIKILTVENQSNIKIYNKIYNLFKILNENDWMRKFIFWELDVIKLVGYDINFNDYIDNNKLKENVSYVPTLDGSKDIPLFLLNKENTSIKIDELKNGFKIVGDFLNKSVLIPNNINYPPSRIEFVKLV